MDIRPILSTLRRHKTASALIVLEIALTCAIVCNAMFLIATRLERMDVPSGLAESELLRIRLASTDTMANGDALTRADLATLRALPGVKAATTVNQVPFGDQSSISGINLDPAQATPTLRASWYLAGDGALATLGLRLVEGRDFLPEEFQAQSAVEHDPNLQLPSTIVDRNTAARLFPGKSAVGQSLYVFGSKPTRIIGVVERLAPARPDDSIHGQYSMIVPVRPAFDEGSFLVRTDPVQRVEVLRAAVAALERADGRRIVMDQQLFSDLRSSYFEQDRWMAALLLAVCIALLVVTAFGIVGLASFWVQQRSRMIGVRRALGASRAQILGYFQTENFLLTSVGIGLGMAGAYAINQLLMLNYELPRLPAAYLPFGALALWALGQIAVFGPARRAAALPPVAVMRGA